MNPEMAYVIRPCSLPQNPAFPPCKGGEKRRELGSQAFDIMRFLGADRHRGGSETEISPCSQGAAGNFRQLPEGARLVDELGSAEAAGMNDFCYDGRTSELQSEKSLGP